MDALYRLGDAPVSAILEEIPDPPSYSAIRAKLAVLEVKGYIEHTIDGPRYVYRAIVDRSAAEHTALKHMLKTFFGGSVENAVAALVRLDDRELTESELNRLTRLIEQSARTRQEG
jgi:predicted transcriptional regulator